MFRAHEKNIRGNVAARWSKVEGLGSGTTQVEVCTNLTDTVVRAWGPDIQPSAVTGNFNQKAVVKPG